MFMDIFDLGFSIYDLKPGSKKWLDLLDSMTLRANEMQLYEMLAGMFDYEHLPFRKEFIEEKRNDFKLRHDDTLANFNFATYFAWRAVNE